MTSFSAELRLAGQRMPLVSCVYDTSQATDLRGRVAAKVRHNPVHLALDVPDHDALLAWAHDPHKRQAVEVVFLDGQGHAWETLRMNAAYCVAYREQFVARDATHGAYRCQLTLVDPDGFTIQAGGPASAFVAPAAGEHGAPPVAAASATAPLTKKQRYDARMKKIDAAQAQLGDEAQPRTNPLAMPADATRVAPGGAQPPTNRLQSAVNRLQRNNVAVERAKLSDDAYNNDIAYKPDGTAYLTHQQKLANGTYAPSSPPEGWRVSRVIKGKASGFMAVVYESDFERPPRPVLAFRGTDADMNFPEELKKDAATDALQGLGVYTDAYKQTADVARDMKALYAEGFDITGHSLGGGEASLAGLITGQDTYTFNAAGLHANSIARESISPNTLLSRTKKIQAYFSNKDPLNWNQDHPFLAKQLVKGVASALTPGLPVSPIIGPIIDDPRTLPQAVGIRRELQDGGGHWSPAMLDGPGHSVPPMVAAIEKQKDEDLATIEALVPAAR